MTKLLPLLALIGSLAALVVPNLAAAGGIYTCTGTVGSDFTVARTTVDSNLHVPAGASCFLFGVTVTGNVIVDGALGAVGNTFEKNLIVQGGSVRIGCFGSLLCSLHGGNFILGNAVITNTDTVFLTRTTTSGNLTVVGAGLLDLELSRVDGNVMVVGSADVLIFSGDYGGDVRVIDSTGVRIGDIDVSGVLRCEANTPPPDLLGVINAGAFAGQCVPSE